MNSMIRARKPAGLGNLQRRHKPDYWLVILGVILLVLGLIVVYAISPALSSQTNVGDNYYVNKQLLAILLGITGFAIVSNLPSRMWRRLETPIILAAVFSALVVRVFGQQVNGAYRWIQVGGFSFQSAELIKFALLIWLAGFLADRLRSGEINDRQKTFTPLIIVLIVTAGVVGLVQKDLGSTGVIVGMMMAMGYIAGLPVKRLAMVGGALAIATILLIMPFSYRRDRLANFFQPSHDCQGTGYQTCQALISVGSGGVFGKGLGRGVQAFGYQPEPANDSIFAIYAEKFGFVGVALLLALFVAFFTRLKRIIERTSDDYNKLLVSGVLAWLSIQAMINIGAMLGLLPLKGITLPFISYGGTSVLFVTIAIGIAFQVSRYTSYSNVKLKRQAINGQPFPKQTVEYRSPSI